MRPQLKDYAYDTILEFIRQKVDESGGNGVVVGLSGGIDSALVSRLCVDAVGSEKVLNIFMPTSSSSKADRKDAEDFSREVGAEFKVVEITPAVEGFKMILPSIDRKELLGNVMARCRMVVLMNQANLMGRVVMGTGNKSELLVGYFTKFGDGGVDYLPIGDLYKTEVRELSKRLGISKRLIEKAPSAGLWEGQTDEGELGLSYEKLDQILLGFEMLMDNRETSRETGIDLNIVEMVSRRHLDTVHKRKAPLIPKVGSRTIGLDWRE
jgi:NAD+ synthase